MSVSVKFNWDVTPTNIAKRIVGNDKAQLFMANEARKLMDPYVPGGSLVMSRNVKVYVEDGKGIVEYPGPYGRMQYEGNVMIGIKSHSPWANKNESKIVTGRKLYYSKFRHPMATSHWDKAMFVARKNDLTKAVQNFIDKE